MRVNIPNLWVLKKSLKHFEAKEDRKSVTYWLAPLGKKSGYMSVKYFEPKKEVFEKGHIKNATGELRLIKQDNKVELTLYLDDFESIALDPPKPIEDKPVEENKEVKKDDKQEIELKQDSCNKQSKTRKKAKTDTKAE